MINIRKFQTLFSICSQIKCWFSELNFTKYLSEQQTGKTLISLLPQKQSDLVLHCLSRPFWQANSVESFSSCRLPSDFIWDFGKLPFPSQLGKYIRAKIHEIGKIKAILN